MSDRVIVDVSGIGYEVVLPQFVIRSLDEAVEGEPIEFEIYYHVTDRQLRPTLIGFKNEYEKQFFEKFISVEDIGPQKAARALVLSVSTIARAIESNDISVLRKLPGIGERTAQKMVATLRGKVAEEALLQDEGFSQPVPSVSLPQPVAELREDAISALLGLGHRRGEASLMVDAALKRQPDITTTEDLIRVVYEIYRTDSVTAS